MNMSLLRGGTGCAWTVLVLLALNAFDVRAQAPDRPIPPPLQKGGSGPQGAAPEYLVGAYYFSGWWPESPNRYVINDHDWRPDYPERAPLLGFYNTQQCMGYEIQIAAGYGVDFFQFLWYPPEADPKSKRKAKLSDPGQRLNDGLRYYLGSPRRHDVRFTVEYVNHPPFNISDVEWPEACRIWAKYMAEPTYLRINRKAVFKIHGLEHFYRQCGGNIGKVADRLAQLRDAANQAGAGSLLIGAGVTSGDKVGMSAAEPFDWLTTYMDMPPVKAQAEPYPYNQLIDFAADSWKKHVEKYKKTYVPYVPAGWDPRPWGDKRPPFKAPTREEWRAALDRTKTAMDNDPQLTMPTGHEKRQKMLLIYAWNEFGEGGIVAPTRGDQYMKLEVIREVFAPSPTAQ